MNSSEAFLRAALYEECSKSQILKYIDVDSADVQTLRELLNANNLLNIRKIPIILSKFAVKMSLKFAAGKFPKLNSIITPDNINVNVESDELEYLLSTTSAYKPSLIFIVSKNIIIGVLGTSIDSFKTSLLETADKFDLTTSQAATTTTSSNIRNSSSSGGGNNKLLGETVPPPPTTTAAAAVHTLSSSSPSSVKSFKTRTTYNKIAVRSSDTSGQVLNASPPSNYTDTFSNTGRNSACSSYTSDVSVGDNNDNNNTGVKKSLKRLQSSSSHDKLQKYAKYEHNNDNNNNVIGTNNNNNGGGVDNDDDDAFVSDGKNNNELNNNNTNVENKEYDNNDDDDDNVGGDDGISYKSSKVRLNKSFTNNNFMSQYQKQNSEVDITNKNKLVTDFLNNNEKHSSTTTDNNIINLDSYDDDTGKQQSNKVKILENITINSVNHKDYNENYDDGEYDDEDNNNMNVDDDDNDDDDDDDVVLVDIKDRADSEYAYSENNDDYNNNNNEYDDYDEQEQQQQQKFNNENKIKSSKLETSTLKSNALSFDDIIQNVKLTASSAITTTTSTITHNTNNSNNINNKNNVITNKNIVSNKKNKRSKHEDDFSDDENFTL